MLKKSIIACVAALGALLPCSVDAAELNPHAYALQRFSGYNHGGYARLVNGQEDLNPSTSCSTAVQRPSINKEMWVILRDDNVATEWIEAGQKKGLQLKDLSVNGNDTNPQQIYWGGHFIGRAIFESTTGQVTFRATPYSNICPTGSATYQIKQTGIDGEWIVYINGNQALTISNTGYSEALYIDLGLESKDNLNTFTSGTYADLWQRLSLSNTWTNVSNSPTAVTDRDANIYNGMNSTYSSSLNRVTLTHN
ncbi:MULTISPECIES: hypothetical protein [unclassified Nostoc]|uniref:hypothetical protein n=1 Tax=unclassified Nostoc TaxID=2593658 RepID=UPI0025DF92D3|nr:MULTISPECIES: hypothetical protein [unclassified Nostoc]MBN3905449.1 hypothetical protein [Nostoc sp. NMS1]MBN3994340.1 hypothetical protein [Nostoc sp. NMS2]